ncbi:MAG: GNAT family N-acetyltransferase [Anaerolineae bacterium]|uniref:GNAT family N-acetyltransferase n=1 Tax=Promineifilum sp. TaxID=2664178 RepID=UPI001DF27168|nr:GNAT family N-acetyltransferase [Anaerolineales bacterium]MCB8936541.1 GNAT family N-acetyltransferase [Promineifilum sp.]MCO5178731.1 GNAT family N-acetyltransferase [Promineifilum sp.]MCW5846924.1 GNAT family N-acetyltransferase [Anaerolineae bacterium]
MQPRSTDLKAQRRAVRRLLKENDPTDAMAAYYAFHHPDDKTTLVLTPEGMESDDNAQADGYVALSRTGMDLFRPLVTMRLPTDRNPAEVEAAADLIGRAIAPGQPVILSIPVRYRPLIDALFHVQSEERLRLLALDPSHYEPIINVLVRRSEGPGGLPRFSISASPGGQEEVVAAASLNWQSPRFGEIAVNTRPQFRRQGWGRSVVAALSGHLIDSGRRPLYVVSVENDASAGLAESVGFTDTGAQEFLLQAVLK